MLSRCRCRLQLHHIYSRDGRGIHMGPREYGHWMRCVDAVIIHFIIDRYIEPSRNSKRRNMSRLKCTERAFGHATLTPSMTRTTCQCVVHSCWIPRRGKRQGPDVQPSGRRLWIIRSQTPPHGSLYQAKYYGSGCRTKGG
ncbi:hypothetical protein BDZ89DRAFT_766188 [Hymenopellis radicata]|nr:hypothetical protein BDZ89DRAFT_766188 [Hymenopellis radicata]